VANNKYCKLLCVTLVGFGILLSISTNCLESDALGVKKRHLFRFIIILKHKMETAGSAAKKRITKLYKSFIGDESCSANEVILARLIVIIATVEIYHNVAFSSWWIRIQSHKAIQHMKRKRLERLEHEQRKTSRTGQEAAALPNFNPDRDCCICREQPLTANNFFVEPRCGNKHSGKICIQCLNTWSEKNNTCPICRGLL
jgi:hypothetical protein